MRIASEYICHGFTLVDVPLGKKGPIAKDWNKRENVISDTTKAEELKGNIGLAHAFCLPMPTMALDIDDLDHAAAFLAAKGINIKELMEAPDSVQVKSGKPKRAKLVYKLPFGAKPIESIVIKEKVEQLGVRKDITILEFRCSTRDGHTVHDLIPPSIHPETGQPYEWAGNGDWRNLPIIPARLLAVWLEEIARDVKQKVKPNSNIWLDKSIADTPRQRALLSEILSYISADCAYEIYRDMVWAILSIGWHDAEEIAQNWCQTAPHRYDDISFNTIANNYDETRSPTYGTIVYLARERGWHG